MKRFKRLLITLIAVSAISLSGCDFLSTLIDAGLTPEGETDKWSDSFANSKDGKTYYVTTDYKELNFLSGMKQQVLFDVYVEGSTPDFDGKWSGVTWYSDDTKVAKVNDDGLIEAVNVGDTVVHAQFFSTVRADVKVHVLEKVLTSIEIKNPRKSFLLDSNFSASFTCLATFSNIVTLEIDSSELNIDSSSVDMSKEGEYPVNVSYTFGGVTKSVSYSINVFKSVTYEPKPLDYTYNDVGNNKRLGWYCPNKGTVKALVVPIYFTDSNRWIQNDQKEQIRADLNTAFFGEGTADGWNSVSSYYKTASRGALNLTGKVTEWFYPTYSTMDMTNEIVSRTKVVEDVVNWYFTNNSGEKLSDYDSDHNGVVDALYLIFGAPNKANDDGGFWGCISFRSNIIPAQGDEPAIHFHMWASYEELYEDNSNSHIDSHVYTHECGHTFGLSDYYDYGENDYRYIGGATMMFHNTHQQDPYSTLSLGWSDVYVPETSCMIELSDYQTSHTSILLSSHPTGVNSPFDEYILVELYAPIGLNEYDCKNAWRGFYSKGAQNPGIRLWHVDARIAYEISAGVYQFTTDPNENYLSNIAFTNSYGENHGTALGREYDDYSLLVEMRNNKEIDIHPNSNYMFSDKTLFHAGDEIVLSDYSSQFVKGNKLNNDEEFGWKIGVESISKKGDGYAAVLNLEFLL